MHAAADASKERDEDMLIAPPNLTKQPQLFWCQTLEPLSLRQLIPLDWAILPPSTTMLLRWQDPYDPDELIVGWKLTVYSKIVSKSGRVGGGAKGSEDDDDDTEVSIITIGDSSSSSSSSKEGGGGGGGDGEEEVDGGFFKNINHSRAKIFPDDEFYRHLNVANQSEDSRMLESHMLDSATLKDGENESYSILRVDGLEPDTEYKFALTTLSTMESQHAKKKGKAGKGGKGRKGKEMSAKMKKKNHAKLMGHHYSFSNISMPSPTLSTCVDYPDRIPPPDIEDFVDRDGTYGKCLRWYAPKERGIEVQGYRIELKKLSEIDKKKRRSTAARKSKKETKEGKEKKGTNNKKKKQANTRMIGSSKESNIDMNSDDEEDQDDNNLDFASLLLKNEKKFGDSAGAWVCVEQVQQDSELKTGFSVKLRCGVADTFPLHPGRKYKVRISSFARHEDGNGERAGSFLFHKFGEATKEFVANAPKELIHSTSFVNTIESRKKKKREAEVAAITGTQDEANKLASVGTNNKKLKQKSDDASNRKKKKKQSRGSVPDMSKKTKLSDLTSSTKEEAANEAMKRGKEKKEEREKKEETMAEKAESAPKKERPKLRRKQSRSSMVTLPSEKKSRMDDMFSKKKAKSKVKSFRKGLEAKEEIPDGNERKKLLPLSKNELKSQEGKTKNLLKKMSKKPGSRVEMIRLATKVDEAEDQHK